MTQPASRPTRVMLVDDDELIVEALADLVRGEPDLEVVGTAGDADTARTLATVARPDVAVVDVKMPGGGAEATRFILSASRGTRVLALSAYDDRTSVRGMIRAGAIGYIVKGAPATEIIDAVRRAAGGVGHLSDGVAVEVVRDLARQLEREANVAEHRQSLLDRVARALEPGAIVPVYQPIVDLRGGRIVGVEALARFAIEPRRSPDAWFRDAFEAGRTVELDIAAVRAEIAAFADPNLNGLYISLNVAPDTIIRGSFLDELIGLPTERIVLEVTEHAPVSDYDALADALAPFRSAGGRLAVDDAGAGFASLRHILRLDPDLIKLDLSLTRDVDTDRRKRALAAALISFAAEMGMAIIAEGVETESELTVLRQLGAGYAQGYYLRRPCPFAEATLPIEPGR